MRKCKSCGVFCWRIEKSPWLRCNVIIRLATIGRAVSSFKILRSSRHKKYYTSHLQSRECPANTINLSDHSQNEEKRQKTKGLWSPPLESWFIITNMRVCLSNVQKGKLNSLNIYTV